ncbi:MAG: BBP7 family outer membrane beta-barrel protein [Pirellulales bacterium]|nr:BBP7 family outer membrane beta-barrel protein [Pirellulales bacterium]
MPNRILVVLTLAVSLVCWGTVVLAQDDAGDPLYDVQPPEIVEDQPVFDVRPPEILEEEATPEELPKPSAELESFQLKSSASEHEQSDCLDLLSPSGASQYQYDEYDGCDEEVCCDCTQSCFAQTGEFWIRADYVMWWTRGMRLPPLLTSSPVGYPPGVWGETNTETLFGNSPVHQGGRSSARLSMGYWLDACNICALEGDYFDLGQNTSGFSGFSLGDPVFARPYYDVTTLRESSRVVAYPDQAVGQIQAGTSDYFESAGIRIRRYLWSHEPFSCADDCMSCTTGCYGGPCSLDDGLRFRLDLISGYRYYRLADRLTLREIRTLTTSALGTTGTTSVVDDTFRATNEFSGGEFGLIAQFQRGRWTMNLQGKMGLGSNRRVVRIGGSSTITTPGAATAGYSGGLMAQPTNMDTFVQSEFVVIPQFGLEIGYELNSHLRAYLGYDFLYWADVARAGDQMDRGINPTQIPPGQLVGASRPSFDFQYADFWAQGINAGLELRF